MPRAISRALFARILLLCASCSILPRSAGTCNWIDPPVGDSEIPLGQTAKLDGHATSSQGLSHAEFWISGDPVRLGSSTSASNTLSHFQYLWQPEAPGTYVVQMLSYCQDGGHEHHGYHHHRRVRWWRGSRECTRSNSRTRVQGYSNGITDSCAPHLHPDGYCNAGSYPGADANTDSYPKTDATADADMYPDPTSSARHERTTRSDSRFAGRWGNARMRSEICCGVELCSRP